MRESRGERGDRRRPSVPEEHADELASVRALQVLAPLGDVQRTPPECHACRRRVWLEVRDGPRASRAAADEALPAVARPAARPAEVAALRDLDDRLRWLAVAELVTLVD